MERRLYVMYFKTNNDQEFQETFWFGSRDEKTILKMAVDFAEKMKKEYGKEYRILLDDHETSVPQDQIDEVLRNCL